MCCRLFFFFRPLQQNTIKMDCVSSMLLKRYAYYMPEHIFFVRILRESMPCMPSAFLLKFEESLVVFGGRISITKPCVVRRYMYGLFRSILLVHHHY